MTVHPHPLARSCPLAADGKAATRALPAVGPTTTTTALALADHHPVFARTASFAAFPAVAPAFLAGVLLCLRASRSGALPPDPGAMARAQAAACCWFSFAASGSSPTGRAVHGGSGGAIHLATTLVTVCALRAVTGSRFRLSAMVHAGLRGLLRRLRALMFARTSTVPAEDPSRFSGTCADDDTRAFEALCAGAAGRRGPPRRLTGRCHLRVPHGSPNSAASRGPTDRAPHRPVGSLAMPRNQDQGPP